MSPACASIVGIDRARSHVEWSDRECEGARKAGERRVANANAREDGEGRRARTHGRERLVAISRVNANVEESEWCVVDARVTGKWSPSSAEEVEVSNDGASARVGEPANEDAMARARAKGRFRGESTEEIRQELYSMGQRELQAMFTDMFNRATTSNNNQWLRRRIATGLGLEELVPPPPPTVKVEPSPRPTAQPRVPSARRNSGRRQSVNGASASMVKMEHTPAAEDKADFTADGVRKSRRAVKPKAMFDSDAFPSAAKQSEERRKEKKRLEAAEQAASTSGRENPAGKASVGRRLRVYWPFEQQFFAGVVAAYNARTNMYLINYDDGDQEEIVLSTLSAQQCAEEDGQDDDRRKSTEFFPSLDASPDEQLLTLPHPGKSAEIVKALPASWPNLGALVWGRVKGHGWWPGTVHAKCAGSQGVHEVSFFDNSIARVHRHDLLPFREYYSLLRDAKKTAGYDEAVARATESYESRAQRSAKRRAMRQEEREDDAPRIWHFEKDETPKKSFNRRMKEVDVPQPGSPAPKRQRATPSAPAVEEVQIFGAAAPQRQLSDLTKSLEQMKTKVVPLVKQSQKVFVKHLDNTNADDDACLISADERVVMLDELASIEALIAWSEGRTDSTPTFQATATTDLDFMNPLVSIGDWKDRLPSNGLPHAESALLRQRSQELLNGDLAGIQWNMDAIHAIADPMGLDPLGTGLGGDIAGQTAPSTPEQHGLDSDSPFSMNIADSCATLHGTYVKGEADDSHITAATRAS